MKKNIIRETYKETPTQKEYCLLTLTFTCLCDFKFIDHFTNAVVSMKIG